MRQLTTIVACGLIVACGRESADTTAEGADTVARAGDTAVAGNVDTTAGATGGGAAVQVTMRDAAGRELGVLTLTDSERGIAVSGALRGLPPGRHGMHVHMTGRCDPGDFASAGRHWNPTGKQHGRQNPAGPHFGDMPNLDVAADGTGGVQATTIGGSLRGENALLDEDGAAIVIHSGADDETTDPAGGSGTPIACGVVRAG